MPASCRRPFAALALLSLFVAWPAAAIDESDLLPVDQAYVLSAEAAGPDAVRIHWKIADGYYLYRHRTSVAPASASVRAGALRLPKGEPHEDEFFGKTETYRGELVATLPDITVAGDTLSLKIKYQGCADAGICYPPQTRTLAVTMPGTAAASTGSTAGFNPLAGGGTSPLGSLLGAGGKAPPLPEEKAFGFEAIVGDGDTLLLRFTPAPGYYLYRDRSAFRLDADGVVAGKPRWPKGEVHHDEHFGDVIVYFAPVDLTLPLVRTKPDAQTATLRATFQGCQNDGICYPPMTRSVRIALPRGEVRTETSVETTDDTAATDASAATVSTTTTGDDPATAPATLSTPTDADTAAAATTDASPSTAASPTDTRASGTLFSAMLLALLGGLILNLMPCVLPVLSIKVLGLIENNESAQGARSHALWYAAGVLLSFVALGAAVLALRHLGQALGWGFQLQKPGVVSFLGLVMFAFGLSLSGVWHVGGRWTGVGHGLASRGGAAGDFFTGVLAVVVAAPCTAPFMAPALGWAFSASTVPALLVFACLGLGLALPFLLVGFVPALARVLPKPGAWMDTLKRILAFPLYLTAAWLVWVLAKQRGADAVGWWAVAAIAVAFAAWAWTHARMRGTRWGIVAALLALLSVPWMLWTISKLPAADAARVQLPTASDAVPFSEQRLADLRKANRVVLVNMTADWCVTCKANEKAVFARDGFKDALAAADAVYMVGDWTDVDPAITAYLQRYKAVGVPLYVVYPRDGGEGTVLPTVLTPTLVREALAAAAQ
ncbi:protein-disulfide reductase DsbD [Lysobacter hankyongensis]|uniref:Protein-disulfide reductase DsbD n=1 Tax=Lysobacter hankyongensis TaxID=1176535 RepID=A0ABP9C7A0_9GAMM